METKIIHLENKVPERLEKALVKAADEFGWEARIEEKSKRGYRNGFVRETEDYSHTMIHLNGRFLPALKITFNKNNSSLCIYDVCLGDFILDPGS